MKKLLCLMLCLLFSSRLFAINGDMGLSTEPLTDGSATYPYLIEDFADFNEFRTNSGYWSVGDHTKLMCDLDLDPTLPGRQTYSSGVIAGDGSNYYWGIFDGNGYTISNLTISSTDGLNGLFGYAKSSASISNVTLTAVDITVGTNGASRPSDIGGICGLCYADITNCHVSGTITSDGCCNNIGLLAGHSGGNSIQSCSTSGTIKGSYNIGGLIGYVTSSSINECTTNCTLIGENPTVYSGIGDYYFIGGMIGQIHSSAGNEASITNCTANAIITTGGYPHAVAGFFGGCDYAELSDCMASGSINTGYGLPDHSSSTEMDGVNLIGGFCGFIGPGSSITRSGAYVDIQVEDQYNTGEVKHIGGFSGSINNSAVVSESLAIGSIDVANKASSVGGFVGNLYNYQTISDDAPVISDCYSETPVSVNNTGSQGIAIFCGTFGKYSSHIDVPEIINCYASEEAAIYNAGVPVSYFSFCPNGTDISVSDCFWDLDECYTSTTTVTGAVPEDTTDMQTKATFNYTNGWDLVDETLNGTEDIWYISDTAGLDYPRLTWEVVSPYKPVAEIKHIGYELQWIDLDGGNSYDPDGTIDKYEWIIERFDGSGSYIDRISKTTSSTLNYLPVPIGGYYDYYDFYRYDVTLSVKDDGENWSDGCQKTYIDTYLALGSNIATAEQELNANGISVGGYSYDYSELPAGQVFGILGTRFSEPGSQVWLRVSQGAFDWDSSVPGDGSENNPWVISTPAMLMACDYDFERRDDYFVLANNIDMSGFTFNTAVLWPDLNNNTHTFEGPYWFRGNFDGAGYAISNITINASSNSTVNDIGPSNGTLGLFGKISTSTSIVKNLSVNNIQITGDNDSGYFGGLAGTNFGIIDNCSVTGDITVGSNCEFVGGFSGSFCGIASDCTANVDVSVDGNNNKYIGGFAGDVTASFWYPDRGVAGNCSADGEISINGSYVDYVGGFAGITDDATIQASTAKNTLTGQTVFTNDDDCYGGFIGYIQGVTEIGNCYSTGNVSGGQFVAGFCGAISADSILNYCYSNGSISGISEVKPCIGYNYDSLGSNIVGCFWDVDTDGFTTYFSGDNNLGATGKTTTEMQDQLTFTGAGWDFVGETANGTDDIWYMPVSDYPILDWEN